MKSQRLILKSSRLFVEMPKAPEAVKKAIDATKEKLKEVKEEAKEYVHQKTGPDAGNETYSTSNNYNAQSAAKGGRSMNEYLLGAGAVLLAYMYYRYTRHPEVHKLPLDSSNKPETKTPVQISKTEEKKNFK